MGAFPIQTFKDIYKEQHSRAFRKIINYCAQLYPSENGSIIEKLIYLCHENNHGTVTDMGGVSDSDEDSKHIRH